VAICRRKIEIVPLAGWQQLLQCGLYPLMGYEIKFQHDTTWRQTCTMKETTFCWFIFYMPKDQSNCLSRMVEDLCIQLHKSLAGTNQVSRITSAINGYELRSFHSNIVETVYVTMLTHRATKIYARGTHVRTWQSSRDCNHLSEIQVSATLLLRRSLGGDYPISLFLYPIANRIWW
jgi:hypothetical protein